MNKGDLTLAVHVPTTALRRQQWLAENVATPHSAVTSTVTGAERPTATIDASNGIRPQ